MKRILKLVLPIIGKANAFNYIFLGILTGLCSFSFINTVTRVIGTFISGNVTTISKEYGIIFISIILAYVWSRRALALTSINLSLRISWTLRKQILTLVLRSDYLPLSKRISQVQTAVLNDVGTLTNASLSVIDFSISVMMSLSCVIYMASISVILFLITLFVAFIGVAVYYFTSQANMKSLEKSRKLENIFQANLNAVLYGFKEIYMEPKKGQYIYSQKILSIAEESYSHNLRAITGLINNQLTGQILFYLLISSVLTVFSVVLHVKATSVVSYVFTLLYLLGSIESIMAQLPVLMRAGVASDQLFQLRKELADTGSKNLPSETIVFGKSFQEMQVQQLEFEYREGDNYFNIGPVDFSFQRGDIVFLYGENGSGKSTFVYSIIGLYLPLRGEIKFNNLVVNESNHYEFKSRFSVVFSDFYLFPEILGIDEFDSDKWIFYLELFELDKKVFLDGRKYSTTDLSTGQRKRLALVATLMERKPILVMDEWAADQDPYFRKKFYTHILPILVKEGITILAITHDDGYYYCADKLFKMDKGQLVEENLRINQKGLEANEKYKIAR